MRAELDVWADYDAARAATDAALVRLIEVTS